MKNKLSYRLIYLIIILFLCLSLCVNQIQISHMKSKIERLERYSFNHENIVFLGDSITSRYNLDKYFSNYNIINSDIAGNQTTDILNDLHNRVYKYNPSKVFILIGTNDLVYSGLNNDSIKNNIEKIIGEIKKYNVDTKIYLQSIYPVNNKVNKDIVENRNNDNIRDLNNKIKDICNDDKCMYIDMYNKLVDKKNNMKRLYTVDGLHLSKIGYRKVTKELLKYMEE